MAWIIEHTLRPLDLSESELNEMGREGWKFSGTRGSQCVFTRVHAQGVPLGKVELTGAERIAAERKNHINKWSAEHDDGHGNGELCRQAADLIAYGKDIASDEDGDIWGITEKHRGDRAMQLVIAGSLIAAEIDRLERLPL